MLKKYEKTRKIQFKKKVYLIGKGKNMHALKT